jgi:hypothetical protein
MVVGNRPGTASRVAPPIFRFVCCVFSEAAIGLAAPYFSPVESKRTNRTKMPNIGAVESLGAPSPMIFLDLEQFFSTNCACLCL